MSLVHTFEDNWTIHTLKPEELEKHNELAHDSRTCLHRGSWERRLKNEGYCLMAVKDEAGVPQGTILLGEAERVLNARAGSEYTAYMGAKVFDQNPRQVGKKSFITLECIPKGFGVNGDPQVTSPFAQKIRDWYEALPIPEEFQEWDANNPNVRTAAQQFVKIRREKLLANG